MTLLSNLVMGLSGRSQKSGAPRGLSSKSLKGVTAEIWMKEERERLLKEVVLTLLGFEERGITSASERHAHSV